MSLKKNHTINIIENPKKEYNTIKSISFPIDFLLRGKQTIHFIQEYSHPVERVFSFYERHENLAKIYPGAFKRVMDSLDPGHINGIGSIRRITTFPFVFEETITRFKVPELIEYRITAGSPFKNHIGILHFLSTGNNSCLLDYTIEFEPQIPGTGFLLKNTLERVVGNGIRQLDEILNSDSSL